MFKPLNTMRSPEYLSFIRTRACSLCGATPVDPHHAIRHLFPVSNGGLARKGSDFLAVALCRECHGRVHNAQLKIERVELLEMIVINLVTFLAQQKVQTE